jgi:hypothetical protein
MMMARLKPITVGLVLLSGVAVGVMAFARGQKDPAKPEPLPAQGAAVPVLRAGMPHLKARIETAREILNQDMERLTHGGANGTDVLEEIPFWSRRLMEDRLRLTTTPAERLDAIREHRNRMVVHERLTGDYVRAGQGHVSDALKGRYYRLEADQLLAEAGVDPAKEPPVTAPKGNPGPPPPAPPSPTQAIPR